MDAVQQMQLFGSLIYVAIAVAAIGFILAVIFFFVFDIRDVYALRTGKAKRDAIERMSARNEQTGRLRATTESVHSGSLATDPIAPSPATDDMDKGTGKSAENDTTLLNGSAPDTTVLGMSHNEMTVLGGQSIAMSDQATAAPQPQLQSIRFDITESTIIIHTDELI